MSLFANSNAWEFYKGYVLTRTSDDIRETKNWAKVQAGATANLAASTRQMTGQLDSMLSLQKRQEEISAHMARQASANNELLRQITDHLDALAENIRSVEFAVREQTEVHRSHYARFERENLLKEIVYDMKKFQDSMITSEDSLCSAYGAKWFREILERHKFGTKDLSSFEDKEYLDRLIKDCEIAWKSLDEQTQTLLCDIEKLSFAANDLKAFDIDDYLAKTFPLKPYRSYDPLSGTLVPPERPIVPLPKIMAQYPEVVSNLEDFGNEIKKLSRIRVAIWLGIPVLATVCFVLALIGDFQRTPVIREGKQTYEPRDSTNIMFRWQPNESAAVSFKSYNGTDLVIEQEFPGTDWVLLGGRNTKGWAKRQELREVRSDLGIFIVPVIGFIFSVFILAPAGFIYWLIVESSGKRMKRFGIQPSRKLLAEFTKAQMSHATKVRKAEDEYNAKLAEYEKTKAYFQQADEELSEETRTMNDENRVLNLEITENNRKLKQKHFDILAEFSSTVNDFVDRHPCIQRFIQKISVENPKQSQGA